MTHPREQCKTEAAVPVVENVYLHSHPQKLLRIKSYKLKGRLHILRACP